MASILTSTTFREKIDVDTLLRVIKYAEEHKEDSNDYHRMMNCLYKIKANIKNGYLEVKYETKEDKEGRIYPKGYISLGQIYRPYRHTLSLQNYLDLDFVNCHPTLLYENTKNDNDIKTTQLTYYVENRNKVLQQVQEHYNVSKDVAKDVFCKIINNGSYSQWKKDNNLNDSIDLPFILQFQTEMKYIILELALKNKELYQLAEKKAQKDFDSKKKPYNNPKGTFMSFFLCRLERKCLEVMVKYIIDTYKTDEIILCHDGFMIPKHIITDRTTEQLEDDLSQIIGDAFDYDMMRVISKPMDEFIPEIYDIQLIQEATDDDNDDSDSDLDLKIKTENFLEFAENCSHLSLSDTFYSQNEDKFIFVNESLYYVDKFNVWKKDSKKYNTLRSSIIDFFKVFLKSNKSFLVESQEPNKYKAWNHLVSFLGNSKNIQGIIDSLIPQYSQKVGFDENPYLFALNDKCYDFKKNAFRNIKPEDYITMTSGYFYEEPNLEKQEQIMGHLKKIQTDPNELTYLLQSISRALLGICPQKANFCMGSGGNGKSILFTQWLPSVFGDYYQQISSGVFTQPIKLGACPELAILKNKRLVVCSELSQGTEFNTGTFNILTGGDGITARGLYADADSFITRLSLFVLTNFPPKFDSTVQENLTRRCIFNAFETRFTANKDIVDEKNRIYLGDDSIKEKDFIDSIKVQLLHILLENFKVSVVVPKSIQENTESYWKSNSSDFVSWFNESYTLSHTGPINKLIMNELVEKGHFISLKDVYDSFKCSDVFKFMDKNEKKRTTHQQCIDYLTKSIYTKYYIEKYQPRINGTKTTFRNILVGFKSNFEKEIEFNDSCVIEKDI